MISAFRIPTFSTTALTRPLISSGSAITILLLALHLGVMAATMAPRDPEAVPEGLAKSDWAGIRAAHEAGRHAILPTATGWQARNPGQKWLTTFDERGFIAQPQDGDWQWGLELQGYGFGDSQQTIGGSPVVKTEGQRLSYQWDSTVQEWFINDSRGLEHGFTVAQRPAGESGRLRFTLGVRGGLRAQIQPDGQGVSFLNAHGAAALNYTGLKVWDADGKTLPARFEPQTSDTTTLILTVDEQGARYPLTVDPIAQQAYLKASDTGANDQFGRSVAVSGDTVVVGAWAEDSSTTGVNSTPNNLAADSGAAYVFVRNAGVWTQQAYLKASNTGALDQFGYSVAISGDTVVVGAWGEDSGGTNSGAAYVFVRSGVIWTQQGAFRASTTGAGDQFGYSVAVAGDTMVVGALAEDSSTTGVNSTPNENAGNSGAAYVFIRSGTVWSQQAYLKASNTWTLDYFGISVAISGDTVVVGAWAEDSITTGVNSTPNYSGGDAFNSGAAYVFARSGTVWTQQAYLKASNTGLDDQFGYSVAVSGNTVVVGAWLEDSDTMGVNNTSNNLAENAGAAYVFTRSGTAWSQQAYLKASNTGTGDQFGFSVAVSGNTVVVGAWLEDGSTTGVNSTPNDNGITFNAGAAYVFTRSGTAWTQQAYLKASNTGADDFFGVAVAVSGDTGIIGANFEDSSTTGVNSTSNENAANSGATYAFLMTFTTVPTVITPTSASITATTATLGGNVTTDGGEAITERGVVFSATTADANPNIGDVGVTKVTVSGTTGIFTTPVSGLTANTGYSFKAYAINSLGTTYTSVGTFTTPQPTPEIAIEQPLASNIADGGSRNFGSVALGADLSLTFVIKNSGDGDLTGLAISQGGTDSADFTVTASPIAPVSGPLGNTSFTVRFSPGSVGAKTATLHIASNDADENPFDITLTGTGTTAVDLFDDTVATSSSLVGSDAEPSAVPFNDGVSNLLKYAFNMNLAGPDSSSLTTGTGTAGLPAFALVGEGAAAEIRMEFLRRKGSGLIYAPKLSHDLITFEPMSGAVTTITSIDSKWERVLLQKPSDPAATPCCFGIVEVILP